MTEKVIKPIFFQKNNYSNLVDLDKKIKKLESLKIINLIMSYVVYRDNNKMLKYVSRNISIWKMCLLVLESYVRSKTINEKDIIENIQCSIMTGNTYIKELVELDIFYQEPDEKDKRKKNIFPSSAFLSEMNIFIEYLQNKFLTFLYKLNSQASFWIK